MSKAQSPKSAPKGPPARAILIDVAAKRLRYVPIPQEDTAATLAALQELVGGYIDCTLRLPKDHMLIVDDEGLFKPKAGFFTLNGHGPYAGNGVVTGPEDAAGVTHDVHPGMHAALHGAVRYMTHDDVEAWARREPDAPATSFTDLDSGERTVIATRFDIYGNLPRPDDKD